MSKNDKPPRDVPPKDMEARLSRHAKAVDDLIHADVTNSPAVDPEELRKYRSGFKLKLPPAEGGADQGLVRRNDVLLLCLGSGTVRHQHR